MAKGSDFNIFVANQNILDHAVNVCLILSHLATKVVSILFDEVAGVAKAKVLNFKAYIGGTRKNHDSDGK